MKIKWLGHASFLITSEGGTKIITDPFENSNGLYYNEIDETANIVTISHDHFDHNNVAAVKGNPQIVKGTAEIRGIKINSISTFHDETGGSQRGINTVFCFDIDGMNVCHLGDLGHPLSDKDVAALGEVDVLLTPVGGFFTIDARVASHISDMISPKVIIPMHFKNDKCDFSISGVDEFLKGKNNVTLLDASEVELKAGELPSSTQIMVLKPSC